MIPCTLLSSSFSHPHLARSIFVSSNPSSSPNTTTPFSSPPPPIPTHRFLCRYRRKGPSLDPNAESVRGGRFRFRDEPSSGEVGGGFGHGRQRRWWSDTNSEDGLEEEYDSIYDDVEDGEQLWDQIWIFKVFRSYGYLLPAIIASMLLATGPKAFLMALALPLGQSVISLAIDKLWRPGQKEQRTNPKSRRKPFSRPSTDFGKQEHDESSDDEFRKKKAYQSWVAADTDLNDDKVAGSERRNFGGWDELDQRRVHGRWRTPGAERSSQSSQEKMGKLSKGRFGDSPLFLRLLIAVFPFLGSWIRIL